MTPQPPSPAAARDHVAALRERGGTYRAIAQAAGIAPMTVRGIAIGRRRPSTRSAAALLAVTSGALPRARVDAGGTRLRLRALQVMGHGSARIARAAGGSDKTIRALVSGQARTVSPRLRDAITEVYDTWWDKRPPERTRSERAAASAARRRAIAGNWCAGAALDDDQLDTPGYRPGHGWKPARGTGTATDIHRPALPRNASPGSRAGRLRPPAGKRKDPAMTQHERELGPPPGTRPPAYVVELWVSDPAAQPCPEQRPVTRRGPPNRGRRGTGGRARLRGRTVTAASEPTKLSGPGPGLAAQHADRPTDQRAQAARSVTCPCQAQPGQPCAPAGDHLARYVHAEQSGAITRQSLTQVIAGLDVIAPHVLIQPAGDQATHVGGAHTVGQVIRTQMDVGMIPARTGASAESVARGRSGHFALVSDAVHWTREAGELEAGG
jgi:hypothetical protein